MQRRRFMASASSAVAGALLEAKRLAWAAPGPMLPSGPILPSAARQPRGPLGPLQQIDAGLLNVGYAEAGPVRGTPVILLHGWPYDIHSYVNVVPLLASAGYRVLVPYLRGYGTTRFLSREAFRNAQQSAVALDVIELMNALSIERAIIGGFDWGARTAGVMAALWPERCRGIVAVSGYLITNVAANQKPLAPAVEAAWWYQYYFATERGRLGYERNRREFNRLIWKEASPRWAFDNATFERSAAAFDNSDHVSIVIHNYRWRLGLAPGESQYDKFELALSERPTIAVPAITIASDFDGAGADGKGYRDRFSGKYAHRILRRIGHNVPQEAPRAFAKAIVDLDGFPSS